MSLAQERRGRGHPSWLYDRAKVWGAFDVLLCLSWRRSFFETISKTPAKGLLAKKDWTKRSRGTDGKRDVHRLH